MSARISARHGVRLGAALIGLLAACAGDPVAAWLSCDCNVELQRTVARGDAAVTSLTKALRDGPTSTERANYVAQVAEQYRLARRFRDGTPRALSDSAVFVNSDTSNLIAGYQKRAAMALRGIGTSAARQALHQAALDNASGGVPWRADVQNYVALLDRDDPITSVTVTSPVSVVAVGGNLQLAARVRGAGLVGQDVAWAWDPPAMATISAGGLLTRLAPGIILARACSQLQSQICGTITIGMP